MARIETYVDDNNISEKDRIIGTDGDSSNKTKNFSVGQLIKRLQDTEAISGIQFGFTTDEVEFGDNTGLFLSVNGSAIPTSMTKVRFSKTELDGDEVGLLMEQIGQSNGDVMIVVQGVENFEKFAAWRITGYTDSTNYVEYDIVSFSGLSGDELDPSDRYSFRYYPIFEGNINKTSDIPLNDGGNGTSYYVEASDFEALHDALPQDNPHNVTKEQLGLNFVNNIKNNDGASSDPTPSDDTSQEYSVGSRWTNISTDEVFQCADNSFGAAVWVKISNEGAVFDPQDAPEQTITSSSGQLDLDLSQTYTFRHTLTENTSIKIVGTPVDPSLISIRLIQPAGSSFTLTFPSAPGSRVVGYDSHVVTVSPESDVLNGHYIVAGWKSGVDITWVISGVAK